MNWIKLEQLLLKGHAGRTVAVEPALDHAALCEQALRLAGGQIPFQRTSVSRMRETLFRTEVMQVQSTQWLGSIRIGRHSGGDAQASTQLSLRRRGRAG